MYRPWCIDTMGLFSLKTERSHGKAMIEEAPNVVTEEGLRQLLAEGYLMEVVCKRDAEKRHNSWHGLWVVRAVAEDGREDKMLVTSRSYLKIREFKTIVGVIGLLVDMGCASAYIPLEEGGRERHAAPGKAAPAGWTPTLVQDD